MSTQGAFPILNPNVYLNYLTPSAARDYEISRDIYFTSLGVLAWDILSNLPDDYRLVRMRRFSFVVFAYFIARLAAFVMIFLAVWLKAGSVSNCEVIAFVLVVFQIISTAAASYLFLKRVQAVYYDSKLVQHVSSFLWLACVGTNCVILPEVLHDYAEIADTEHCIRTKSWSVFPLAFNTSALFDTLVYLMITYKILSAHGRSKQAGYKRWIPFCLIKTLPHLSRAVLQDGQQYYLITSGINMARLAFSLQGTASATYEVMLSAPAVVLTSVMACRVYRNLMAAVDDDDESAGSLTTPQFAQGRVVTLPLSRISGAGLAEVAYGDQIKDDGSRGVV